MSTANWHASDEMLRSYARGETGVAVMASVEAHLMRCPVCRARLAPEVDAPLESAWTRVADAVQAPRAAVRRAAHARGAG